MFIAYVIKIATIVINIYLNGLIFYITIDLLDLLKVIVT